MNTVLIGRTVRGCKQVAVTVLLLSAAAIPGAADADDVTTSARPHTDWSVFSGLTRTDNATRLPNGDSDTIAVAGVALDMLYQTGRTHVAVDGSVYYEDYLGGTFKNSTLGHFVGEASHQLIAERLNWVVQDTYGQVGLDPEVPSTPANRLNANVFSTGPDAELRLGSSTSLLIAARYRQADFGSGPVAQPDDRQYRGSLGLTRRLSAATTASLNASASHVEYRTADSANYNQQEFFAALVARHARSELAVDAGVAQLRDRGRSAQQPLLRLSVSRRLTPSWTLYLGAGSEFQNSAQAFQVALAGENDPGAAMQPGVAAGQPGGVPADFRLTQTVMRAEYARATVEFSRPRTRLRLTASERRERFQFVDQDLDRDVVLVSAHGVRRLRPTLDAHATLSYSARTPRGTLPADRSRGADLGLDWHAGEMLTATLAYVHERRTTDDGGFPYRENRVYLGLTYGSAHRMAEGSAAAPRSRP